MKYTIELTNKQKAQMDCMMEIVHRYVGFNPKLEPMETTNIEDTKEYQIGYKTGYDIAQTNAQATKEEWGKAEYDRGFEDGKNEAIHNTELIPELKKCNYTLGYNEALEDVSNLTAYFDRNFMAECYPEEYKKDYSLYDLNAKFGLARVLEKWKTYIKQKENYHKLVNTLRIVTDEYPRETIVSALSEFGIEVKE